MAAFLSLSVSMAKATSHDPCENISQLASIAHNIEIELVASEMELTASMDHLVRLEALEPPTHPMDLFLLNKKKEKNREQASTVEALQTSLENIIQVIASRQERCSDPETQSRISQL